MKFYYFFNNILYYKYLLINTKYINMFIINYYIYIFKNYIYNKVNLNILL